MHNAPLKKTSPTWTHKHNNIMQILKKGYEIFEKTEQARHILNIQRIKHQKCPPPFLRDLLPKPHKPLSTPASSVWLHFDRCIILFFIWSPFICYIQSYGWSVGLLQSYQLHRWLICFVLMPERLINWLWSGLEDAEKSTYTYFNECAKAMASLMSNTDLASR